MARYRGRLSGPLLDRIDMTIEVPRLPVRALRGGADNPDPAEASHTVRQRVAQSRQLQMSRNGCPNSQLAGHLLDQVCALTQDTQQLLERAMEQLGLSARAYHRILRLARTIADLALAEAIAPAHLSEAISYRRLDHRQ